jgi:hypothetical protein
MLVARCEKEGTVGLSKLSVEDFRVAVAEYAANAEVGEDVYGALGAGNVVKRYQSAGAAGGEPLRRQLENWKNRLGIK